MDSKSHWSTIYQTKEATNVSWHQERPQLSLDFIQRTGIDVSAKIIDVGAGASTLVDHLLALGYRDVALLDISEEALQVARRRIGEARAAQVTWIAGDIAEVALEKHAYDLWHDRAVFHFLTDLTLRQRYIEQVRYALKPGGHIIMATFAADGPTQCSGLDVMRYDPASLHSVFGADFKLINSAGETHVTPWGSEQKFTYCYCRVK